MRIIVAAAARSPRIAPAVRGWRRVKRDYNRSRCPCAIFAATSVSSRSRDLPATRSRRTCDALAREFDLGGIILFARNVAAPEQVAEIARDAQSLAHELPLWVSVDQEGGRVARLKAPFTEWPPMLTLGRSGDERLAAAVRAGAGGGAEGGRHLARLHAGARHPHESERTPSSAIARWPSGPRTWRGWARIIITTLQAEGIAACGKHFPGHGDTSTDSHHELPLIEHPPDRLDAVELVPFRAAIEAEVASIMTAHLLVPVVRRRAAGDAVAGNRRPIC